MVGLKLIGSIMVILSSSLIGYIYGKSYSERLSNLIHLENCIKILETEVIYGATPIPDALMNVYKKGNKKVSFIFKEIRDKLIMNKNSDILDSFICVTDILEKKLSFNFEDIEVFLSLGRVLGSSDRMDQEKNFKMTFAQFQTQEREAREEKEKNEKMFKNLGLLLGLAIVIILL